MKKRRRAPIRTKTERKIDKWLLIAWAVLVAFGLIMIASASSIKAHTEFILADGSSDDFWYLRRQAIWLVISAVAVYFFAKFDYRKLRYLAFPLLMMVIFLLSAVFLPVIGGAETLGAKRWLDFGVIGLQPSELTKMALAIYLATWLEKKGAEVKDFKYGFLPFATILGVIVMLLFLQKDLGTTVIIAFMAVVIFFVSGADIKHFLGGLGIGVAMVVILIQATPFRVGRIAAWLDPWASPEGIGYHVVQATITMSSGGIFGLGYGKSIQKYGYLPHPPTDSIFAIISEELGFFGVVLLYSLFIFLLYRIYRIAIYSDNEFGRLLAIGLGSWIGIQMLLNIGGLVRAIPLTGVTLPFVSYGGSSLLFTSIGIGILLSVSRDIQERKPLANSTYRGRNGRPHLPASRPDTSAKKAK